MKKGMTLVAIFLILLVVSIPIAFSYEIREASVYRIQVKEQALAETKGLLPALSQALTSYQNISRINNLSNDAADKCDEKVKKGGEKLAFMDSGVIKAIEGVLNIARAICMTLNAIGDVISTIGVLVVGIQGPDGSVCCLLGWISLSAACSGTWGVQKAWESVFKFISPVCCYLTCGWCTTGCDGFPGSLNKNSGGSGGSGKGGFYGAGKEYGGDSFFDKGGISAIGLSPYDNIYTAIACLCPGAILMNLRKLKVIYQTYDCCVEKACQAGQSTEGCDAMLDESTCMFWEGALISSLAKIITKLILHVLFKYVLAEFIKAAWIQCIIAAIDLIMIPQTITNIMKEWERAMKSFDNPNCSDLGFTDLNSDFSQANNDLLNKVPLSYEDYNKDGYADGTAEESKAYQEAQQKAIYDKAQAEKAAYDQQQQQKQQSAATAASS